MLLAEPVQRATILVAEGTGDQVSVSVWLSLYGPDAPAIARRDEPHGKLP